MRAFCTLLSLILIPALAAALPLTVRQTQAAPAGNPKYVVAHHMVGNTFPYTLRDWQEDVTLAASKGIDGFALNMGSDSWQPDRINDAYEAAKSVPNFKMFLSLDMSVFPCASSADGAKLRQLVSSNAGKDTQFLVDGKALVTTFAGEKCNFGHANAQEGWAAEFAQHPDLAGKIYFVPTFFIDPQTFGNFKGTMDGACAWNSAWPNELTTEVAQKALANGDDKQFLSSFAPTIAIKTLGGISAQSTAASSVVQNLKASLAKLLNPTQKAVASFIGNTTLDKSFIEGLTTLSGGQQKRDGSKPLYMGTVSANFFTHYGPDSFNKNFVFLGDQFLLAKRWENVIASRDQFDIIQLLTWNDFGESHYMGPIHGAQPNSEAWVNGFNHTDFLDVNKYYIQAFKTGTFPSITEDRIIAYARPHPVNAVASNDPVGRPTNADLFQDNVWALVFASTPSTVTLNGKTFQVPAGVSKIAAALNPGDGISATLTKNGATIVSLDGGDFKFNPSPEQYNYNYFVIGASSNDGKSTTTTDSTPTGTTASATSASATAIVSTITVIPAATSTSSPNPSTPATKQ